MKTFLLMALCLLPTFSQAQVAPWAKDWATPVVLMDGKIRTAMYNYVLIGKAFDEIETYIEEIQGKPKGSVKVSADYIEYRQGAEVIYRTTPYHSEIKPQLDLNEEILAAVQKGEEGTLTKNDLRGSNWIHMVQAIDVEEVNCLAISRKNNKASGCADQFQDGGLTDDKLVCFKGKTYIKCHVECIEKIYKRKVEYLSGPCSAADTVTTGVEVNEN